jgi:hypothetical protein
VILVAIAVALFIADRRFVASALHAKWKMIKLERWHSAHGHFVYYPLFNFRDRQGIEHNVRSGGGSDPPTYGIGDAVEVLYPRDNPTKAIIANLASIWGMPAAFLAFGVGT